MPIFHRILNKLRVVFAILFILFIFIKAKPDIYLYFAGIFLLIVSGIFRIWANGCIEKIEKLSQNGPYLLCRHPLYFGNFLAGISFCLISNFWYSYFIFIILFLIFYCPMILEEEKFLKERFREEYLDYRRKVPLFFPRISKLQKGGFSWELARRNREPSQFFIILFLGIIFGIKFFIK